jgi:hypothetical protein
MMRPRYLYSLLSALLLMGRFGFAQTPDTANTPSTAIPVVEGYAPADVAKREASVAKGEPQSVNDWMPSRQGAYTLLSPSFPDKPGGIRTRIVVPASLLSGWNISPYRYPIFAYEETVDWHRLRDGLGMNVNNPVALNVPVMKQLQAMGVRLARCDVGWGNVRFDAPDELKDGVKADLKARLLVWKAAGLRPLVCLDTNPALPCPTIEASVKLAEDLKAGDTSAVIIPRAGETPTPYKSGFSHVTAYWAGEYLWTACEKLDGGKWRVTFGKPWPRKHDGEKVAGTELPCAYFAFEPWGRDEATYTGFQSYVKAVASFLDTLGLRKSKTDPGFDLEICNELSNWLFRDVRLYSGNPADGEADIARVYRESVATLRTVPGFKDLFLINGFHNQEPFGAASTEPAGSSAGSSHYYRSEVIVPSGRGATEDAFTRDTDGKGFVPARVVHAPETIFSAEVLENVVPNISPLPFQMWGAARGRGLQPRINGADINSPVAKEPDGKPARGVQWVFTEWGDDPHGINEAANYHLLGKFLLRGTVVALGKGVGRVYWYAAMGPGLGILSQSSDTLPAEEPESVTVMKRFAAATTGKAITNRRSIHCESIEEHHGLYQFLGNGTPEFPALYNRDILLAQAFQLSDTSFAISLHIPTKDYKQELPEANYTIRWSGVKPSALSKFRYRDFGKTQSVVVTPSAVGEDWVEFTLPVTDTPRLLIMDGV